MELKKLEKIVGPAWAQLLKGFMVESNPDDPKSCPYYNIVDEMRDRSDKGENILPGKGEVFRAFKETAFEDVRVIILGQDPYPNAGIPNGLAFATDMAAIPVSLKKMYEGLEEDAYNGLDLKKPERTGDLTGWTKQGVMLLNTALTVSVKDKNIDGSGPGAHAEIWKPFMQYFIKEVTAIKRDIIWVGMGTRARKYLEEVNPFRNFVYWCEHPAAAARDGDRKWKHNNVFTKANLTITVNNLGDSIIW